MKFEIAHTFAGIDRDAYEELLFDEPFSAALAVEQCLGRTLLRLDRAGGRIVRHVRCEPERDPKSFAARIFGESRAFFIEEVEYDLATHTGTWRTISSFLPDRVHTTGTLEVVSALDGTQRVVRGEVKVSIFLVRGRAEKAIVAEIEKSYALNAAFTSAWIAKHP